MEDSQIIRLYWERSENAIIQTAKKYGKLCHSVAYNILHDREDSEECVNDTYLKAWNSMPPRKPGVLSAYLAKITRNLSLDKWRHYTAEKRGGGQTTLALEELSDCIPSPRSQNDIIEQMDLVQLLNRFLAGLSPENRNIFMRRYWYLCPVSQIASELHLGESKVKMSLLRSRKQLKELMEKEGCTL